MGGLLGCLMLWAAGATGQTKNSCLDCHSNLPEPLGVTQEKFSHDIHAQKGLTCASCHGINTVDQANHAPPTNSPLALVRLLNYWKTNVLTQPAVAGNQGTNYFEITFRRRPAEPVVASLRSRLEEGMSAVWTLASGGTSTRVGGPR